ncbi:hypothetical protein ACQHIV_23530 [Kribbella sp. GL6]|uniref:hypothetical protein n=1 Tax=Kribbella sp. GL6 TaxID=3419765 RepID=UPI003D06A25E
MAVELKEYAELLAVHRALMAARFVDEPETPTLLGSPYLAKVHSGVVDEMTALCRREGRFGEAERWEDWREMSRGRAEWGVVRRRLGAEWGSLGSREDKRDYLGLCFQPFRVSAELVDEMIADLDGAAGGVALVRRFFEDQVNGAVRRTLLTAVIEQDAGRVELRLDVVDVVMDFDRRLVVLGDVPATGVEVALGMGEFVARLVEWDG